mmetsp:Transcript_19804/g.49265  ORF Transcript_19804/g.49265 Transcript_19804/m.49265 type:complete len:123 (+) Transcript_19804:1366-1734(+)
MPQTRLPMFVSLCAHRWSCEYAREPATVDTVVDVVRAADRGVIMVLPRGESNCICILLVIIGIVIFELYIVSEWNVFRFGCCISQSFATVYLSAGCEYFFWAISPILKPVFSSKNEKSQLRG